MHQVLKYLFVLLIKFYYFMSVYGTPSDQKIVNDVLDNYLEELKSII